MAELKVAVVKKSGAKFLIIDCGTFDPMTGSFPAISSSVLEKLPSKFQGLPVLQIAISMVGRMPAYHGDTSLIQYIRGVPINTFKWKTLNLE